MSPSERDDRLFQSILSPVDFSRHSRIALQHAVAIARRTNGSLTAMYADDPLLAAATSAGYDERLLTQQTTAELRRLLARVGLSVDRDPRLARVVCAIGHPAQQILETARRVSADLIVMGTRGQSGARRLFFGSVTEKVLRKTTVPVLAVPPHAGVRHLKSWPGRRIVCAVELSARDREDVRGAARIARAFDSALTLVHVVAPVSGPPWLVAKLRPHDRHRLKAARTRLAALARSARAISHGVVECRAVLGNPAEAIPAAATDLDAGLIVLTLRARHGLLGAAQGSVTYRVLCGAATPVLALHQRPGSSRRA